MATLKSTHKHIQIKVFLYKYLAPLIPFTERTENSNSITGALFDAVDISVKNLEPYDYIRNYLSVQSINGTDTTIRQWDALRSKYLAYYSQEKQAMHETDKDIIRKRMITFYNDDLLPLLNSVISDVSKTKKPLGFGNFPTVSLKDTDTYTSYVRITETYKKHIDSVFERLDTDYVKFKDLSSKVTSAENNVQVSVRSRMKLARYYVQLDPQYLSVFDISDYFTNFSFSQSLEDGIPNWNITLRDDLYNFTTNLRGSVDSSLYDVIARYKSLQDTYKSEVGVDEYATSKAMKIRAGEDGKQFPKMINLSDLIQPYDFMVVYTYASDKQPPVLDLKKNTNIESYLRKNNFKLDFEGFIRNVSNTVSVGSVNSINVTGMGILGLLEITKRFYSPSILQNTIYDVSEGFNVFDTQTLTVYQSVFANLNPLQIIQKLLVDVLRLVSDGSNMYFYTDQLYVENELLRNLVVIPVYILHEIMFLRNYKCVRSLLQQPNSTVTSIGKSVRATSGGLSPSVYKTKVEQVLDKISPNKTTGTLSYFLSSSSETERLRAYFIQLSEAFSNYEPDLKSPLDVIREVKRTTFLEFFELPGQGFIFRSPGYNGYDGTDLGFPKQFFDVYANKLDIISRNYTTGDMINVLSRQKISYAIDFGINLPLSIYSAINGKVLMRYGLNETNTMTNPNARFLSTIDTDKLNAEGKNLLNDVRANYSNGMISFASLILDLHNFGISKGTISCSYPGSTSTDADISIGKMFYDDAYMKLGYIYEISKNCTVGGSYVININLSYIRDYYFTGNNFLNFYHIYTVNDMAQEFKNINLRKYISKPTEIPLNIKPSYKTEPLKTNGNIDGLGILGYQKDALEEKIISLLEGQVSQVYDDVRNLYYYSVTTAGDKDIAIQSGTYALSPYKLTYSNGYDKTSNKLLFSQLESRERQEVSTEVAYSFSKNGSWYIFSRRAIY